MQKNRIRTAVFTTSAAVALGLMGAPIAAAEDDAATVTTVTIGQQAKLASGDVVQGWTITGLKPSSDVIPYTPRGTLWEATATNEAIQGSVQPIVSDLNARSAIGDNYRVLFGVASPQGVNPAPLGQGEKTTGKVYFDVTGESPDRVVYNAGGNDLLVWEPAPPTATGSGTQWTPPAGGSVQQAPAQTAPAPAATEPAPAAAGSQGTLLPAGSAGTPLPEGSEGTPQSESVPATTEVPVPHGSSGTPAS